MPFLQRALLPGNSHPFLLCHWLSSFRFLFSLHPLCLKMTLAFGTFYEATSPSHSHFFVQKRQKINLDFKSTETAQKNSHFTFEWRKAKMLFPVVEPEVCFDKFSSYKHTGLPHAKQLEVLFRPKRKRETQNIAHFLDSLLASVAMTQAWGHGADIK